MDGLIAFLPYVLLLLLCPLLMLLMHRGHDHHAHDRAELVRRAQAATDEACP
jgi:hypothetical protein